MNEAKLIAVTTAGEIEVVTGTQAELLAQVTPEALDRWVTVAFFETPDGEPLWVVGGATNPRFTLLGLL